MNYVDRRVSEYPAQEWARMCEAVYMIGLIDDFDEGTCRRLWEKLQQNIAAGKVRGLPSERRPQYQIVKDAR